MCFIDPVIAVEATAGNIPTIDEPLTLQCTATIVKGITGTVDIIWTTGDTQVRRVNNVTASSNINSTSVYNDSFTIPLLDINDIGTVYQCEVSINSILSTSAKADFTIPFSGIHTYIYVHTYVRTIIWKINFKDFCWWCVNDKS